MSIGLQVLTSQRRHCVWIGVSSIENHSKERTPGKKNIYTIGTLFLLYRKQTKTVCFCSWYFFVFNKQGRLPLVLPHDCTKADRSKLSPAMAVGGPWF